MSIALLTGQCAKSLCYDYSSNPSRPAHLTIEEEYKLSEFVAKGTVLSEQKISSTDDPIGYEATLYTIKISKVFKGIIKSKLTIRSENTSSRFPMNIGRSYIIFVKKDNNDDLFIDNCGNSGETKKSHAIIQKVLTLNSDNKNGNKRH